MRPNASGTHISADAVHSGQKGVHEVSSAATNATIIQRRTGGIYPEVKAVVRCRQISGASDRGVRAAHQSAPPSSVQPLNHRASAGIALVGCSETSGSVNGTTVLRKDPDDEWQGAQVVGRLIYHRCRRIPVKTDGAWDFPVLRVEDHQVVVAENALREVTEKDPGVISADLQAKPDLRANVRVVTGIVVQVHASSAG